MAADGLKNAELCLNWNNEIHSDRVPDLKTPDSIQPKGPEKKEVNN